MRGYARVNAAVAQRHVIPQDRVRVGVLDFNSMSGVRDEWHAIGDSVHLSASPSLAQAWKVHLMLNMWVATVSEMLQAATDRNA